MVQINKCTPTHMQQAPYHSSQQIIKAQPCLLYSSIWLFANKNINWMEFV
jgi:hypothetical protein